MKNSDEQLSVYICNCNPIKLKRTVYCIFLYIQHVYIRVFCCNTTLDMHVCKRDTCKERGRETTTQLVRAGDSLERGRECELNSK